MRFRWLLPLICLAFAGCTESLTFERVTGPLSPGGLAFMVSGGLREEIFPDSQQAFDTCMDDLDACAAAGGHRLQVTPAGRTVLSNLKVMLGLAVAPDAKAAGFARACGSLAARIFNETDDNAYEVSMRLLAILSGEGQLMCAVRHLDALWKDESDYGLIDWDIVKLTGYAELMLAGGLILGKGKGLKRGLVGTSARIMKNAAGGLLIYKGAEGAIHSVELDRWYHASARRFFVGKFRWLRKYRQPSTLLRQFRSRLAGYVSVIP